MDTINITNVQVLDSNDDVLDFTVTSDLIYITDMTKSQTQPSSRKSWTI